MANPTIQVRHEISVCFANVSRPFRTNGFVVVLFYRFERYSFSFFYSGYFLVLSVYLYTIDYRAKYKTVVKSIQ